MALLRKTAPKKPSRVVLSIAMSIPVHERLKLEARSQERSLNWVVNKALRAALGMPPLE